MQKEKRYKDARLNFAVDELTQYRELQRRIEFFKKRRKDYEEEYTALKAVAYDGIRVDGGEYRNKVESVAIKWEDLNAEIAQMQLDSEHQFIYIQVKLNALTALYREVLWSYYIECKALIDVARNMGYSFEGIKRLKLKALKKYANY